jgi:hypothetical protein
MKKKGIEQGRKRKMRKVLVVLMISAAFVAVPLAAIRAYATETILEQRFDTEATGNVPGGWVVAYPQCGSFTVDESTCFGGGGKSGKFVDSSMEIGGFPFVYRAFSQQTGAIAVEFAVMPTGSSSPNVGLMFYVDDGTPIMPDQNALWNGPNINFLYGDITCEEGQWPNLVHHHLQSYSAGLWYTIRMAIDISSNTYDVYIDGILRAESALFRSDNGEPVTQLSRIHLGATSDLVPVGYFDNIKITRCASVTPTTLDIDPDTLNLRSSGKWITAYVEFPEGYDVADIDISTLLLNGTVLAEALPTCVGDYDDDGISDLMAKFDRSELQNFIVGTLGAVTEPVWITLTITGSLEDGTEFEGRDTIRVFCHGGRGLGKRALLN